MPLIDEDTGSEDRLRKSDKVEGILEDLSDRVAVDFSLEEIALNVD